VNLKDLEKQQGF